jgi:hypothetical protein
MKILHFAFFGALVAFLSLFVACSNDDDEFSGGSSNSLATDTTWYNPSQTEFVIHTAEDLAGLAKLVDEGNDFDGKIIKLGQDIMLNDTANWQDWENNPPVNNWFPIGAYSYDEKIKEYTRKFFNGTFDGNDHVVSGIYFNSYSGTQGLFGIVGPSGTVKNLGVTASYIKGSTLTGGLAGNNWGMISDSYFIGTVVTEPPPYYSTAIGGLVGGNWGTIDNSYSIGTVKGVELVGGLVGENAYYVNDRAAIIRNSYSISTVIGKSAVGGLVGGNRGSIISNSYSSGVVIGEGAVGGLVGKNPFSTIDGSYSTSTVTGENNVGGLIGTCENTDGHISNSYSTGAVTGENNVGGLVGGGGYDINSSYSTSIVVGKNYVGGLIGRDGEISNGYSTGTVIGESNIGGLVGAFGSISNSYFTGTVTGESDVGGLVGMNCFFATLEQMIICLGVTKSYYNNQTSGQNDEDERKGKGKTTAEMKQKATYEDWDFDDVWGISETVNDGYPYLLE